MGLPEFYQSIILIVSVLISVIWAVDVGKAARAFHRYHDSRAGRNLLLSIVFLVAAIGLTISATGFIPDEGGQALAVTGLGIARGALLVGGLVLIVAGMDRRRR